MKRIAAFGIPAFLAVCFGAVYCARLLPSVIGEPMKKDLGLSDTQLGLLTGLAFGVAYGLSVLPLARLADRVDRRWLIVAALLVGAGATLAGGLAASFALLIAARIFISIAEAAVFPATVSLVAERFDDAERARAMAVYTAGIVFGLSVILWAIGRVTSEGWRAGYFLTSAVLVLAAVLVFPLVPGASRPAGAPAARPLRTVLADLRRKPAFLHLTAAMTLYLLVDNAALAWTASFVERVHGLTTRDAVALVAMGSGVVNGIAVLTSSELLAAVRRRGANSSLLLLAATLAVSSASYVAGYGLSARFLAIAMLLIALGLSGVLTALLLAAIQDLADDDERATAAALVLTPGVLLGAGGGPQIVGMLSDALTPLLGVEALAASLIAVAAIAGSWAMLHAFAARRASVSGQGIESV